MSTLLTFLAAIAGKLFAAFFGSRRAAADKADSDAAHERAAVSGAAAETQQAIAQVADERSRIPPPPADAGDLARSLRARKGTPKPRGGGSRPGGG